MPTPRAKKSTAKASVASAPPTGGDYTIADSGPPVVQRQRFSMWEQLFDECRAYEGEWRRTKNSMKRSTAAQLSSDIRNAWKRDFQKSRLKGLGRDEKWDSAWGEVDEGSGEYYLWIKYLGKR